MQQLRAPGVLDFLKEEKPADTALGTLALTSLFNDRIMAACSRRQYRTVIRLVVRAWPELLTEVSRELIAEGVLTVVREPDIRQRPLAKAAR